MKYYFTIVVIIIADQIVKYQVRVNIGIGERINIIYGVFELTNISNSGAAWGSFSNSTLILTVFSAMVSGVILVMVGLSNCLPWVYKWPLSLIASGGIGNLIDRVFFGTVTDMFSFSFFSPVFNVADASVCVGCFFMILAVLFDDRLKRTKE